MFNVYLVFTKLLIKIFSISLTLAGAVSANEFDFSSLEVNVDSLSDYTFSTILVFIAD